VVYICFWLKFWGEDYDELYIYCIMMFIFDLMDDMTNFGSRIRYRTYICINYAISLLSDNYAYLDNREFLLIIVIEYILSIPYLKHQNLDLNNSVNVLNSYQIMKEYLL
jgi:hypothetical protein